MGTKLMAKGVSAKCACGEKAIVAVRKRDNLKFYSGHYSPDLRKWELLCLECWTKWEQEFGDDRLANAITLKR